MPFSNPLPPLPPLPPRLRTLALAVTLFLLAFLPRLAALDQYVTPDEPAWVLRAIHFRAALLSGHPADTLQSGHPGVTTMWLGALGISLQTALDPAAAQIRDTLAALPALYPDNTPAYYQAGRLLSAARIAVALANALALVALYLIAQRRVGTWTAWFAAMLYALDPFSAGLGGLLHVDALATSWMSLAALCAWCAVAERERAPRWWAAAGAFAALAALTKSPAAYGALVVAALAAWDAYTRRDAQAFLRTGLIAGGAFVLTALLVFPALWAAPLDVFARVFGTAGRHQNASAWPTFFLGELTQNPDWRFYPLALALRTTIPLFFGWLTLLGFALSRHLSATRLRTALYLILYTLGFILMLSLAAKKFDRYLLPIFPALALLSTFGWDALATLPPMARMPWLKNLPPLVAIAVTLLLLGPSHPYYLTVYNPLLGGLRTAWQILPVGWGEAAGDAARKIGGQGNDLPWVATPEVASFAALYPGTTVWLFAETWSRADYIFLTDSDEQSDPHGFDAWSRLGGGYPFGATPIGAWLREPNAPRVQSDYLNDQAQAGDLLLFDQPAYAARHYVGPARTLVLTPTLDPTQLTADLVAVQGVTRVWYVPQAGVLPAARALLAQTLARAANAPPETGLPGEIIRYTFPTNTVFVAAPPPARFESAGRVATAAFWPSTAQYPESATLYTAWQPLDGGAYEGLVTLVDDTGHEWVSTKTALPTSASEVAYGLALPPGIPPGIYYATLRVLHAGTDQSLGVWDAADRFIGAVVAFGPEVNVHITAGRYPPAVADLPLVHPLPAPHTFTGGLTILGTDLGGDTVYAGEPAQFDAWWHAPTGIYAGHACDTLVWALVGASSETVTGTLPLSPDFPLETWRAGEVVHMLYTFTIPLALPNSGNASNNGYASALPLQPMPSLPSRSSEGLHRVGAAQGAFDLTIRPACAPPAEALPLISLTILQRERTFTLPPDLAYPLDLPFGTLAHLRGYTLNATTLAPGASLEVRLYWQAEGRASEPYHTFVHLVGPSGTPAQSDQEPAGGTAPAESWVAEQVVSDTHTLILPTDLAPGTYTLAVGMYATNSGLRLPVYGADGRPLPDDQVILTVQVTVSP